MVLRQATEVLNSTFVILLNISNKFGFCASISHAKINNVIRHSMELLKKITQLFRKQSSPTEVPDILFPGLVSAKQFAAFKPKQRMQAVMIVGDSIDVKYYRFLKWCVDQDSNLDVRLAALKRLPNFSGQSDLLEYLKQLDASTGKSVFEPYLSMALSRVGLIDVDEFNSRLNGG
jgi:hypothetical protein